MMIATTLLASGFNFRSRETTRSDALADAQRALNIMSREIGNSGFGLTTNGIVASNSGTTSIRFRANLNAFSGAGFNNSMADPNEDVRYYLYTSSSGDSLVARHDINTSTIAPLANRIDTLKIRYFASKIDYSASNCDVTATGGATEVTPGSAGYIVLTVCVQLPQVSTPGSSGYQPASTVQLTSDVTLRNSSQAKINEY
jgi:hypothetical protein